MQFGVSGGGGAGSAGTEQHPESKMGHVRFKATLPEIYLLRVSSILHPGGKKEKSCNFLFPGIISAHSFRKQVAVKTAALGGRDAGEVWGQMPLKKNCWRGAGVQQRTLTFIAGQKHPQPQTWACQANTAQYQPPFLFSAPSAG